eukprot:18178_1
MGCHHTQLKACMDRSYASLVKLIIMHEIHFLHDLRGAVLESIICRTIRTIEKTMNLIRLVGYYASNWIVYCLCLVRLIDLFKARVLKVLVLIIKGTRIYNAQYGKWTELSMLDILQ